MHWSHLGQDKDKQLALVKTTIKLSVPRSEQLGFLKKASTS
jgi:hypothetical protein